MRMNLIKQFQIAVFCLCTSCVVAQISSAKITYERKTNLYKKFKGDSRDWIKETDKIKIDYFELFITDTCSAFKPQESELREEMGWATAKNKVYQNFSTKVRYTIKNMWGEELHIIDTLFTRRWQITESTRKIAGYTCRKAFWQANDSTRIYAWFSYDLTPSTGPESFYGLPGTILGLATEDGGIVYFAKKIELITPQSADLLTPKKKKVKQFSELKLQMEKEYGKEKWFKEMFHNQFEIW